MLSPCGASTTTMASRRSVLLAAAVAALSACTGQPRSAPSSPTPSPPEPDELLRRALVAAEIELLALYAATRAAHPALAPGLAAIESRHRRHLSAVASSGPVAPTHPPLTSASRSTAPAATPAPPPLVVAPDPQAALTALRAAEGAAAEARVQDCLRCADSALAELVASIAAGEAANGVLVPAAP